MYLNFRLKMSENEKPKENGSDDPKENGGDDPKENGDDDPKENGDTEESQIASEPRPIPEPLKFRESLDFTITKVGSNFSLHCAGLLLKLSCNIVKIP